jgi:hypothetical protein
MLCTTNCFLKLHPPRHRNDVARRAPRGRGDATPGCGRIRTGGAARRPDRTGRRAVHVRERPAARGRGARAAAAHRGARALLLDHGVPCAPAAVPPPFVPRRRGVFADSILFIPFINVLFKSLFNHYFIFYFSNKLY